MSDSKNKKDVTVCVIEDDSFLRELLVRKLENAGFKTLATITGEDGLKIMRETAPNLDVVLLDLVLPGMHGFDVLGEIKKDIKINKIPVIILSNLGQKEEIKKGLDLGAEDFLIKANFTPGAIVKKVNKVLLKLEE